MRTAAPPQAVTEAVAFVVASSEAYEGEQPMPDDPENILRFIQANTIEKFGGPYITNPDDYGPGGSLIASPGYVTAGDGRDDAITILGVHTHDTGEHEADFDPPIPIQHIRLEVALVGGVARGYVRIIPAVEQH